MRISRELIGLMVIVTGAAGSSVAQKKPLASPRDSVKTTISGATIEVNYGRPSMKGRVVVGGLIPYDAVWRTGANEATSLVTSKMLMIGNLMVPAGKYTIYTLASKTGWKLIINKQTGQWGLEYQPELDLGRVDLTLEALPSAVEQFTIKVVPAGAAGALRLEWDKTAASVSFMVH